ncbi:MFS transporter [Leptospira gomenensis]|uniref:MFS transporter n=1 Tax=Leptospira gomenensis TaxID=2484974 RepID=A0A5F1YDE8_9LEPT|nr:MFS transporter [Leptospira gomenensis]TGK33235.1 MFS transporter [Leptospira gomenensis]TGK35533.1 MFS transporter [Leptospira gomenensis]TGK40856.1 MFS transporter [Leptospira gomenensis]TGK61147.1 MFS transporter [Leptospira gomenensis]
MNRLSFVLFFTVFIDMMGFSVIFPIFPETLKIFLAKSGDPVLDKFTDLTRILMETSSGDWSLFVALFGGIVASLYSLLQFVFAPIWGKISDRVGRKPILVFTSLGSFFGYAVWLFSGSFSLFVFSRIITGMMGGNISVASAAMADITNEKDRAKGMGLIGAGVGLGFIAGPPTGGLFAKLDLSSLELLFPGITLTVFPASALAAASIAFVNLLMILFWFRETLPVRPVSATPVPKKGHPIFGVFTTENRAVVSYSLLYFLFVFAFSGFEFSINFYLSQFLSYSPSEIGFTFVYIGLVIVLIQGGVFRRLSGKIKETRLVRAGSISLVLGFGLLYFVSNTYQLFIALTFLASGSALLHPSLSTLVSLVSGKEEQGTNLGMFRSLASLGRGLAPFAFCLIYFSKGPAISFLTSGVICFLFLAAIWKLKQPHSHNESL